MAGEDQDAQKPKKGDVIFTVPINVTVGPPGEGMENEGQEDEIKSVAKEDCPNGDIKLALGLVGEAKEATAEENLHIADGVYYLEGGLGNQMMVGDELDRGDLTVAVRVKTLDESDLPTGEPISDMYSNEELGVGSQVAYLGRYESPVSPATLKYMLSEAEKDTGRPPDVTITEGDLKT